MEYSQQGIFFPINTKKENILKAIQNLSYFTYYMRDFSKSLVKYPFFLKGNPKEDEGATYFQIYDEYVKIYIRIKTLIETDYFIKIVYQAYKSIPTSFEFEYIINIFFTGIDNCILFSNFRYSKKISLPRISFYEERERRKKIFLKILRKIAENDLDKIHISEILINAPFKLVNDIFLNMKVINKYVNFFGDIINYEGNIIKEKMNIDIYRKNNNKKEFCYKLFIEKIERFDKETVFIFQKENDIKENITLIIYGDKGNSMFYFFNKFNTRISQNYLNNLNERKECMLFKLKRIIENYYKSQTKM